VRGKRSRHCSRRTIESGRSCCAPGQVRAYARADSSPARFGLPLLWLGLEGPWTSLRKASPRARRGLLTLAYLGHSGVMQPPSPCVSFLKQQRLACKRRFLPGWIARKLQCNQRLIRTAPETHRHHHGRQRSLGETSPLAAHGGHRPSYIWRLHVETAARIGIPGLSVCVFEENWKKRPRSEVDFLMACYAATQGGSSHAEQEQHSAGIIGRQHELPPSVQEKMA